MAPPASRSSLAVGDDRRWLRLCVAAVAVHNAASLVRASLSRGPGHGRRQRVEHRDADVERHRTGAALPRSVHVDRRGRRRPRRTATTRRALGTGPSTTRRAWRTRRCTCACRRRRASASSICRLGRLDAAQLVALRRHSDLRRLALRARRASSRSSRAPRARSRGRSPKFALRRRGVHAHALRRAHHAQRWCRSFTPRSLRPVRS